MPSVLTPVAEAALAAALPEVRSERQYRTLPTPGGAHSLRLPLPVRRFGEADVFVGAGALCGTFTVGRVGPDDTWTAVRTQGYAGLTALELAQLRYWWSAVHPAGLARHWTPAESADAVYAAVRLS